MSKAHVNAVAKYNAATYERYTFRLKKEEAKMFRDALNGKSVNGFIRDAIIEKIEREKLHGKV